MEDLLQKKCVPLESGVAPLTRQQAEEYKSQTSGWTVSNDAKKISKEFKFGNFSHSLRFVNRVASIAESENHHPDIHISFDTVKLELWTHTIGGLSENDFILAAKINQI